ncbi:MAG TPA: hypothetical protein VLS49_11430 [Usitatibacter sp.]|nr:hypothetical protein [Usitatibacter sp.]
MAETFAALRADRSCSFALPMAARAAFGLFTPQGEKAWAQGWDPEYLHPGDGRTEPGMVFRTSAHGEETIWTVSRFDPEGGFVEYVRCTPGSRIAIVSVRCADTGPSRCEVSVRCVFTGLSAAGNARIREMDERRFAEYIGAWRSEIEAMLAGEAQ